MFHVCNPLKDIENISFGNKRKSLMCILCYVICLCILFMTNVSPVIAQLHSATKVKETEFIVYNLQKISCRF